MTENFVYLLWLLAGIATGVYLRQRRIIIPLRLSIPITILTLILLALIFGVADAGNPYPEPITEEPYPAPVTVTPIPTATAKPTQVVEGPTAITLEHFSAYPNTDPLLVFILYVILIVFAVAFILFLLRGLR